VQQQTANIVEKPAGTALFPRVLCAVDGKDGGYAAIEQAASLCGPEGSLTLLVVTSFRNSGEARSPAIGPSAAHEIVERAEAIADAAGVPATVEVEPAAPPAHVVLGWASDHDLLALGPPVSSWLGGMLLAGVTDSALGRLETPILTARPRAAGHFAEHLLIASDGLGDSTAPVAIGGEIARMHGSHVTLLHAVSHQERAKRGRLADQAEELRELGAGEPDVMICQGRAHEVILDAAERLGTSLVVIGSRRRTGASTLGSVSRRVVHDAACSVLTVPPEYVKAV
jgi:nucleotide-binding universal stress UspA family protein